MTTRTVDLVITGINSITAIGHDAVKTARSVFERLETLTGKTETGKKSSSTESPEMTMMKQPLWRVWPGNA
jgi:hypothetical protein